MAHQFGKHYTRDEARALIPKVRAWLGELNALRRQMDRADKRLEQLLTGGNDVGGVIVDDWLKTIVQMQRVLGEFQRREIQVKDLERGLIDFPAVIGGKEVFLCWEQDEEDIEYWHDIDTGYAGREKL